MVDENIEKEAKTGAVHVAVKKKVTKEVVNHIYDEYSTYERTLEIILAPYIDDNEISLVFSEQYVDYERVSFTTFIGEQEEILMLICH
jgi:hypothetical protein